MRYQLHKERSSLEIASRRMFLIFKTALSSQRYGFFFGSEELTLLQIQGKMRQKIVVVLEFALV